MVLPDSLCQPLHECMAILRWGARYGPFVKPFGMLFDLVMFLDTLKVMAIHWDAIANCGLDGCQQFDLPEWVAHTGIFCHLNNRGRSPC